VQHHHVRADGEWRERTQLAQHVPYSSVTTSYAQTSPAGQATIPLTVPQHAVVAPLMHSPSQHSVKSEGPAWGRDHGTWVTGEEGITASTVVLQPQV
jgi:hypothetical protein